MSKWSDDYDTRWGVDPSDYDSEDDFLSARMSARGDFKTDGGSNKSEGCYIATCVYGSYDAPEVRTLRQFRDDVLKNTSIGRAFIRCYYTISPKLVAAFGTSRWFRNICKRSLDCLVSYLRR